ncbi:MAG: hypothetical protein ABI688_05210 [Bacteroidota bacterium]
MKKFYISFILALTTATLTHGQQNAKEDTCILLAEGEIDVFIPGYIDTIQSNGLKVRAIHATTLVNGFELVSTDSLVRIVKFQLTFDDPDGNLYTIPSVGNKIPLDQTGSPLRKISGATLITIDKIVLRYRKVCYRIKGQVYLNG